VTEKIIIAGSGGQGIMLLGKVLAEAAMREKKNVTFLPAYGAEVRGGTAYCMVIISDEEIGSTYIEKADCLIAMNAPSLERFKGRVMACWSLIVPWRQGMRLQNLPYCTSLLRIPLLALGT
jgi:2-oxoglutarate ferredoxin oxidoreductase subunit gamma